MDPLGPLSHLLAQCLICLRRAECEFVGQYIVVYGNRMSVNEVYGIVVSSDRAAQEVELSVQIKPSHIEARELLIVQYLRLVAKVAQAFFDCPMGGPRLLLVLWFLLGSGRYNASKRESRSEPTTM